MILQYYHNSIYSNTSSLGYGEKSQGSTHEAAQQFVAVLVKIP
jgi:hypothetical protein